MPKIQFYVTDIRTAELNNKQAVLLFGRSPSQRVCIIDDSFLPYFYVIPKEDSVEAKLLKIEVERDNIVAKVVKIEKMIKKSLGREKDVLKVFVALEKEINILKSVIDDWEIIEGIYEHDVPYVRKYVAERGMIVSSLIEAEAELFNANFKVPTYLASSIFVTERQDFSALKMLAFDIETYAPQGKQIDMKNNPVIMVAFYAPDFQKVITWKRFRTDKEYIEFVNSEVDLVERFVDVMEKYAPDVIIGFNSDGFDFPYLDARARKYKVNLNLGLENSRLKLIKGENSRARIPGMMHIDIYKFIRKSVSLEGGYSLHNIAQNVLQKSKKDVDLENLYKVWDEGIAIEDYCEYNLTDAELTFELCRKFLPQIIELSSIAGISVDYMIRLGYSQIVESFLLRQAFRFNELAPPKPDKNIISKRFLESYKGSFVYEPQPGIYHDIVVFDFRSLYPSIMISHNISPDTLDCPCCPDEMSEHHFCQKRKGFLPIILEDLIGRRERAKKNMIDSLLQTAQQETLKILANSFYGYLGFYGARWYSIETANAVTALGRHYITQVIEKAKLEGFNVIYSDTDSIFIALKDKTEHDARAFIANVNASFPGVMSLEFEAYYTKGLFVPAKEKAAGAKKKYALLSKNGFLKIRGFESIRTNYSEISREAQRKILELILKTESPDEALSYLNTVITQLREKIIKNKQTMIEITLQKNLDAYDSSAPHVTVARKMREKGIEIYPGLRIPYIIVAGEGRINERAMLPEEVPEGGYDSEYYVSNQILPTVEKIFELFGIKREDLDKISDQKNLGEF